MNGFLSLAVDFMMVRVFVIDVSTIDVQVQNWSLAVLISPAGRNKSATGILRLLNVTYLVYKKRNWRIVPSILSTVRNFLRQIDHVYLLFTGDTRSIMIFRNWTEFENSPRG